MSIVAHSLRVPSKIAGKHGIRTVRQPVTMQPESGKRRKGRLELSSLSPL